MWGGSPSGTLSRRTPLKSHCQCFTLFPLRVIASASHRLLRPSHCQPEFDTLFSPRFLQALHTVPSVSELSPLAGTPRNSFIVSHCQCFTSLPRSESLAVPRTGETNSGSPPSGPSAPGQFHQLVVIRGRLYHSISARSASSAQRHTRDSLAGHGLELGPGPPVGVRGLGAARWSQRARGRPLESEGRPLESEGRPLESEGHPLESEGRPLESLLRQPRH